MTKLYRVKGEQHLVKDSGNQAILNTDLSAVKRHEERLTRVHREIRREADITQLRNEMSELKMLLKQLIETK